MYQYVLKSRGFSSSLQKFSKSTPMKYNLPFTGPIPIPVAQPNIPTMCIIIQIIFTSFHIIRLLNFSNNIF